MNQNFQTGILLNEQNWTDVLSDMESFPFRFSEIRHIHKELEMKKISFKYNICGKETYRSGNKEIILHSGEYLIATNYEKCEVFIDEMEKDDLGICIDINEEWLAEGINALLYPESYLDNHHKHAYFLEDHFFNKFQSNVLFDAFLRQLFLKIKHHETLLPDELSCDFIRTFLFHHTEYIKSFQNIPALKKSTKKELYEKMISARNKLNDSVYSAISITEVSNEVYMSHFRFFHLFKDAFGISPHKYLLQLKLNEARQLFKSGKHTWTEIASLLHFADLQSFSKLFKKYYRMNPSEYARNTKAIIQ